jgi:hypothetical protein
MLRSYRGYSRSKCDYWLPHLSYPDAQFIQRYVRTWLLSNLLHLSYPDAQFTQRYVKTRLMSNLPQVSYPDAHCSVHTEVCQNMNTDQSAPPLLSYPQMLSSKRGMSEHDYWAICLTSPTQMLSSNRVMPEHDYWGNLPHHLGQCILFSVVLLVVLPPATSAKGHINPASSHVLYFVVVGDVK